MINKKIKLLRELNKKNRKEVAHDLKIPYTTYARYEKGDRQIPLEIINQLANYYNVSIDYLFGRKDLPLPVNEYDLFKNLNLSIEELLKKYKFNYDGIELNNEEIEALLELIKKLKK